MKELFTDITLRNGEVKKIKVELEDELAEWLETQPEEVYRDFLLFEYKSKCVKRKETRRTQSLDASLSNGFEVPDEDADVHLAVLHKLTSHILERNSMVLLEQLKTVDKSRIDSYIGTLSDEEMKMIDKALRISLAIGRYKKRSV